MSDTFDPIQYARSLGYSEDELRGVPEGWVGHGCGNPVALAELQEGETVLDVGSGGGLDAFLAVQRVATTGRVIGVDSSVEMVAKAAEAAAKGGYTNVVFKVGRMEHLPLDDESVDVVISNRGITDHRFFPDSLTGVGKMIRRCGWKRLWLVTATRNSVGDRHRLLPKVTGAMIPVRKRSKPATLTVDLLRTETPPTRTGR